MLATKKTNIPALLIALLAAILVWLPLNVSAQAPPGCETGSADSIERCVENYIQDQIRERCSGMSVDATERCAANTRSSIQGGDFDYDGIPDNDEDTTNFDADCRDSTLTKENCGIIGYLILFINVLTAIVGIVSAIMITVWGIQYSVSRDNPQMVASARLRILQTVTAVIIYLFVYAFLQWVVPGGIF